MSGPNSIGRDTGDVKRGACRGKRKDAVDDSEDALSLLGNMESSCDVQLTTNQVSLMRFAGEFIFRQRHRSMAPLVDVLFT